MNGHAVKIVLRKTRPGLRGNNGTAVTKMNMMHTQYQTL